LSSEPYIAGRLAAILKEARTTIEVADLERRVVALEIAGGDEERPISGSRWSTTACFPECGAIAESGPKRLIVHQLGHALAT